MKKTLDSFVKISMAIVITSMVIMVATLNSNICMAVEPSSLLLAEGMTIQDIEKSLGITTTKKKKSTSSQKKSNKKQKAASAKSYNQQDDLNVDELLKELNNSPNNKASATKNDESADSNLVESIGVGNLRSMPYAEMIIINKITTKRQNVIFKMGEVKFFGNISVEIHKCVNDPNLLKPNNMMLMTIFDNKIDDDKLSIFHGWMMSNNLSASTLEHPVYEIIPVTCRVQMEEEILKPKTNK